MHIVAVAARNRTQRSPEDARELYAPRPLCRNDALGRLLLAFEVGDCTCKSPTVLFGPPCKHVARLVRRMAPLGGARLDRLFATLRRAALAYDREGYEPDLRRRGPVWLEGGGARIDVARGVTMATQAGWVAVYMRRAEARLPLFHPRDRNPRSSAAAPMAVEARKGKRAGGVVEHRRSREVAARPGKGREPGHLDRVLIKWGHTPAR